MFTAVMSAPLNPAPHDGTVPGQSAAKQGRCLAPGEDLKIFRDAPDGSANGVTGVPIGAVSSRGRKRSSEMEQSKQPGSYNRRPAV